MFVLFNTTFVQTADLRYPNTRRKQKGFSYVATAYNYISKLQNYKTFNVGSRIRTHLSYIHLDSFYPLI